MNTLPPLLVLLLVLLTTGCSRGGDSGSSGGGSGKSGGGSASASKQGGSSADTGREKPEPGTVEIKPEDQPKAGIRIGEVEVRAMPQRLSVVGQVAMDEQHTSHIGAIANGRITDVYVLPGAAVRRGALLARMHSDAVHETVGALKQAFAAVDRQQSAVSYAQQLVDRYTRLYGIQAASLEEKQHADQALAQSTQELADAEASVHAEREHLSELLQVDPETLTPANLYDRELVPIRSPIDGVVVARNVTVGQVVEMSFDSFDVSNLGTVWVIASVNEQDVGLLRRNAHAGVTTQGFPNTSFAGTVAMIGDTLDPSTRTLQVRIVVPNPHTSLRPGMFATAEIDGPGTRDAIFIPEKAVQDVNGNQVVFVTPDGSHFSAQVVKLGSRSEGKVEVTEGLKRGDHLAVDGAFMVKGELLKGTLGDG